MPGDPVLIAFVTSLPWEDSIVALIGAFLLLLFSLELATRKFCKREGHTWQRAFDHTTQRERFRCEVCGTWEGDDFP